MGVGLADFFYRARHRKASALMTASAKAFNWNNFPQFMSSLFGEQDEQIEILTAPQGDVYAFRSEAPPFIGRFTFFDFNETMRAIIVEGTSHDDLTLDIVDGEWVRFNFALSINISMDGIHQTPVQVTSPSWRIIDHPNEKVTREILKKGAKAQWLTIICKHARIKMLTGRDIDDLPEFFRFVDASQERSTQYRDFVLRSRFASITTDVLRSDVNDPLDVAYLEARCTQLLCLALEDLIDPIDTDRLPALNEADNAKILAAKAYIDDNFLQGPTVQEISSAAGLNRNSLFYGFKQKFGVNVSEYVQDRKLQKAKMLIQHTDQHLMDIAEQVGFRHQSSFITAFKKRFGTTPGKLRRGA